MRIVGGQFGGRRLKVPRNKDIRPTSDKVRGAIFNALEARGVVEGAHVLDGFCGTGALGLEALSRGATHCIFVDQSRASLDLAKENADDLDALGQSVFLKKDLGGSFFFENQQKFDLVFLDAPYHKNLISLCLQRLGEGSNLNNGAFLVLESEKGFAPNLDGSFEVQNEKIYGDTQVLFVTYTK